MAVTLFKVWFKRHLPLGVPWVGWGRGEEMTFEGTTPPTLPAVPSRYMLSYQNGGFLGQLAKQQFCFAVCIFSA